MRVILWVIAIKWTSIFKCSFNVFVRLLEEKEEQRFHWCIKMFKNNPTLNSYDFRLLPHIPKGFTKQTEQNFMEIFHKKDQTCTFTSPQRFRLAPRERCSWTSASPRDAAWPRPSSCWKCTPANRALRSARTPPAGHWARPPCPAGACREGTGCVTHRARLRSRLTVSPFHRPLRADSPGLVCVNGVQHGRRQLQVPAELLQVHDAPVHLLQGRLQPGQQQERNIMMQVVKYSLRY